MAKKTKPKEKPKSDAKQRAEDLMFKAASSAAGKTEMSREERMGSVFTAAQKVHGQGFVSLATRSEALVVPRVSTGSLSLDIHTNGGWPLRRIAMAIGPESGGKTNSFLRGVASAQKLCANCLKEGEFDYGEMVLPDLNKPGKFKKVETQVIVDCPCGDPRNYLTLWEDAEGVWLPEWSERLGVWAEKVILQRPQYGEQACDFACAMIESGTIDCVVIDSIANLTPLNEIQASMKNDSVGVAARNNNRFIRKLVSGMNRLFQTTGNTPTVWAINQYRKKIGVMFGPNDTLPGGEGQKFASSLTVECKKGKIISDDKGTPIEGCFHYKVTKNKVGTEGAKGEYSMCKAETDYHEVGDIIEYEQVIDMAVDVGFIEKPNAVMYEYEDQKFRGKGQLEIYLTEHSESYNDLKAKILAVKLGFDETT